MKKFRKMIAVVLAITVAMTMGIATTGMAFAANADKDSGAGGTGTITITNAQPDQNYEVYRIFEAIVKADDTSKVSYKMLSNKTLPDNSYFKIENGYVIVQDAAKDADDPTKLSADAVEWLKANYTTIGTKVTEVTPTEAGEQNITNLLFGYYYVTTQTGTAVSVDTTNNTATITDKNPGTTIDKTITGVADGSVSTDKEKALAQIGTVVSYEVRIPIADNAKSYEFKDVMTDGLTYNAGSMKVYVVDKNATVAADATGNLQPGNAATQFGTLTEAAGAAGEDADVSIKFSDAMLAANNGKDIVLHYTATVNSNAVVAGANPNTATIYWGNKTEKLKDTDDANVYTAQIDILKQDNSSTPQPLPGAGFVIKNAANKYYKLDNGVVTWVDSENSADEHVSGADGKVAAFTGLANGTYTLVEKTVPSGYNKLADQTVTIAENDFTAGNLSQTATVTNNAGAELPSTGGIGTTIFYILGALLVVGCGIILIARRRMSANN